MGHHREVTLQYKDFFMSGSLKKYLFLLIGLGLLLVVVGTVISSGGTHAPTTEHAAEAKIAPADAQMALRQLTFHGHEPTLTSRILSNLLLNGFFFMAIALLGIFFLAVSYAANAGWFVLLHRIPEAMGWFMPIGMISLLIVLFASGHSIYHWTDHEAVAADALLHEKAGYLNMTFFIIRNLLYFTLWLTFFFFLRKFSIQEDTDGGTAMFKKRAIIAPIFIIIFAVSFSSASWDWIMSIEAHWFSTMFGVYTFASSFVSAMALITVTAIYLYRQGFMPNLNSSHFHDLGKFVFAFSIFWAYIWFCQFLLIWYANIPEEGVYFINRLSNYPVTFFTAFFLCFLTPFLVLLHKHNMRNLRNLAIICFIVVFGHWMDFYNMVMPGAMKAQGSVGFIEIGMFLTFLGLFLFVTGTFLGKAPLVPKNHPYLKESLMHEYH